MKNKTAKNKTKNTKTRNTLKRVRSSSKKTSTSSPTSRHTSSQHASQDTAKSTSTSNTDLHADPHIDPHSLDAHRDERTTNARVETHLLDGSEKADNPLEAFAKSFRKVKTFSANKPSASRFDKKAKKKRIFYKLLADGLERVGVDELPTTFNKRIIIVDVCITILLSIIVAGIMINNSKSFGDFIIFMFGIWTAVFAAVYWLSLLAVFMYFDVKMYKYTKEIEDSLPDFLQLTAANISAGMTMDRALWYAVRPKFKALAREMELIAKSTATGDDLEKALKKLAYKYDSRILRESMNLIVAGMNSGGEMAGLLNKIATNIKDTNLIKKEISASVMAYVIFIAAATIVAAPLLFALSTQLLVIIKAITSSISIDRSSGVTSLFSFNFSGESISVANFQKFALLVMSISAFFSAAMVSTIRKGNVKDGLKLIPIFIAVSLVVYFICYSLFSVLFAGLF